MSFGALAKDACEANAKSDYDDRICQVKRLQRLNNILNQVYKAALATMPEKSDYGSMPDNDNRKEREQLRKSQRAWLIYRNEQCALEGGLQGGSNNWVSTFSSYCEEKETKLRIKFLKTIVSGDYSY